MKKSMTVADLYESLTDLIKADSSVLKYEVSLPTQEKGMIGSTSVSVVSIGKGFDWNSNKILLETNKKIAPVKEEKN
jgi:hypothetical protein